MKAGTALPAVLLALALSSALVVSGAYVSRQVLTAGRLAQRGAELSPAAEAGLARAIATWNPTERDSQPVGTSAVMASEDANTQVWITRTAPGLFWLVAESRNEIRPPLKRRIGVLVQTWTGRPQTAPSRAWSELQ